MSMSDGLYKRMQLGFAVLLLLVCFAVPAFAQDVEAEINGADTAWILVATALVIMMTTPALALFYGGLVSQRNVLSTLMHSFVAVCLISIQWVLWGYSFSFGDNIGGYIGGTNFLCFEGVVFLFFILVILTNSIIGLKTIVISCTFIK